MMAKQHNATTQSAKYKEITNEMMGICGGMQAQQPHTLDLYGLCHCSMQRDVIWWRRTSLPLQDTPQMWKNYVTNICQLWCARKRRTLNLTQKDTHSISHIWTMFTNIRHFTEIMFDTSFGSQALKHRIDRVCSVRSSSHFCWCSWSFALAHVTYVRSCSSRGWIWNIVAFARVERPFCSATVCRYGVDKFRLYKSTIYSLKVQVYVGSCWFIYFHVFCFDSDSAAVISKISKENEKNQFRRPGGVDEK